MKINDLAGLSKPIKKLIDVLSQGAGAISQPYLTKNNADAYAIKVISEAIKENQSGIEKISYSSGNIELLSSPIPPNEIELSIEERATKRLGFQENNRQMNIEEITAKATTQLSEESEVSDEAVDKDWIARFFNIAQDISEDEMQKLWAKILAGEIKQPKSFSLRTLELLKNITKDEAGKFTKSANYIIIGENDTFILDKNVDGQYLLKYGITFDDILLLQEIGILRTNELAVTFNESSNLTTMLPESSLNNIMYFEYGDFIIKINKLSSEIYQIPTLSLTKFGCELLKLIEIIPNEEYMKDFCLLIQSHTRIVEYSKGFKKNKDGTYNVDNPWTVILKLEEKAL